MMMDRHTDHNHSNDDTARAAIVLAVWYIGTTGSTSLRAAAGCKLADHSMIDRCCCCCCLPFSFAGKQKSPTSAA